MAVSFLGKWFETLSPRLKGIRDLLPTLGPLHYLLSVQVCISPDNYMASSLPSSCSLLRSPTQTPYLILTLPPTQPLYPALFLFSTVFIIF